MHRSAVPSGGEGGGGVSPPPVAGPPLLCAGALSPGSHPHNHLAPALHQGAPPPLTCTHVPPSLWACPSRARTCLPHFGPPLTRAIRVCVHTCQGKTASRLISRCAQRTAPPRPVPSKLFARSTPSLSPIVLRCEHLLAALVFCLA